MFGPQAMKKDLIGNGGTLPTKLEAKQIVPSQFLLPPSRTGCPVLPDWLWDAAQGPGGAEGNTSTSTHQKAAHFLSSTVSHYPKRFVKPGARF